MSVPPATHVLRRRLGRLSADAADALQRLAFWTGVVLPCVHLPVLAVYGVTSDTTPALLALWVTHAAALLAGRRHVPGGDREDRDRRGGDGRTDSAPAPTTDRPGDRAAE